MGKATKATKKYVSSGQLKKAIQARHKKQQITKKIQARRGNKGAKGKQTEGEGDDDEDEDAEDALKSGRGSDIHLPSYFLSGF